MLIASLYDESYTFPSTFRHRKMPICYNIMCQLCIQRHFHTCVCWKLLVIICIKEPITCPSAVITCGGGFVIWSLSTAANCRAPLNVVRQLNYQR
ncbi:hypothetical protein CEXT_98991 [Caerostris extrusa]|uniref:Uncharacterized protein n=1 Tax=Caerostris extrusa TaxID=172846 RepID=A0AAV4XCP5_CAEEX|nr:hypothetical protein CEXT_98991 [Caerostris extrusa]